MSTVAVASPRVKYHAAHREQKFSAEKRATRLFDDFIEQRRRDLRARCTHNYFLNCCDRSRRHAVIPSHLLIHETQTKMFVVVQFEFAHLAMRLKSKMHAENAFFMQQASRSALSCWLSKGSNDAMVQRKNYNRKIHFFVCLCLQPKMTRIEVKIYRFFLHQLIIARWGETRLFWLEFFFGFLIKNATIDLPVAEHKKYFAEKVNHREVKKCKTTAEVLNKFSSQLMA